LQKAENSKGNDSLVAEPEHQQQQLSQEQAYW
jgi:hypothetical protein